MIPILNATTCWQCPSCGLEHVIKKPTRQTPLHQCPKHSGAWVPFVPAGMKAAHRINERQDYLGDDIPTTDDNGRVIQSVQTVREDGEDCHVFATCVNYDLRKQ